MLETRILQSHELRAVGGTGDSDPLRIEGYAAVFNVQAQLPGFQERMKPGAFTRAIDQKQDVVCLFNHDQNFVLGRTTSGTLRLSQDARGLHYSCDLPNTQTARDIHESIRRGDVNGCSFAFTIPDGGQEWSENTTSDGAYFVQRDISNVNLHDVSPVTYPCYNGTNVQARTADVPMELRSAVDAKNKAREISVVIPPVIERSIIGITDVIEIDGTHCPASWPADIKAAYCAAYNTAYKQAIENKLKGHTAIAFAMAGANKAVQDMDMGDESGTQQNEVKTANNEDNASDGDRAAKAASEKRDEDDDSEDLLDDEFDLGLTGRSYDESDRHANHMEPLEHGDDCSEMECRCQNRWAPTGSGMRNAEGVVEIRTATPEQLVQIDEAFADAEKRGGMTRTKRVAGKDLSASSFAYVGDADKTETWKFPIMDAAHVRNALARFDQAKGIADSAKAGVKAKIDAAAKKFGIDVAAERAAEVAAENAAWRAEAVKELVRIGVVDKRYSDDQPRDEKGRFGTGGNAGTVRAEQATGRDAHQKAEQDHRTAAKMHREEEAKHLAAGLKSDKESDVHQELGRGPQSVAAAQQANAHFDATAAHAAAAAAHEVAAGRHEEAQYHGSKTTVMASSKARVASKNANSASRLAYKVSDEA